jgi:hypothetical protein
MAQRNMSSIAVEVMTPATHVTTSRVIAGALLGVCAGALAIAAIQVGVAFDYQSENPRQTWGAFLWGNHAIIRIVSSALATALASWLAGVAARRLGRVAAMLAALPSVVGWAYIAVACFVGFLPGFGPSAEFQATNANKVASVAIVLGSLPLAFGIGVAAGKVGEQFGSFFDSRQRSLFGIRWYHYLWVPFPIYLLITYNAWAVFYFLSLQLALVDRGALASIVPGLLSLGLLYSFSLTYTGLSKAYVLLARRESSASPALDILKYGCGLPLLALVLQTALNLLHIGLQHAEAWLSK